MAMGIDGHIGLGLESTFGTGVAPDIFFPGTESINHTIPQLRDENPWGGLDDLGSDPGRQSFAGQINLQAYPATMGHLMNALLGGVTVAGGGPPYVHTFKRAAKVSATQARPGYSMQVSKGGEHWRFSGGQCTQVSLTQNAGDRLAVSSDWLFKAATEVSAATPSLPTLSPFRFKHVAHTLGGSDFDLIDSLTINMSNGIEAENLQDGTDAVTAFLLGRSRLTGNMTVAFREALVWDDFVEQSQNAWKFKWTISANYDLEINIPKLKIGETPNNSLGGAGRIIKTFPFIAEYDATLGASFSVVVTNNDVDDYTA